MRAAFRSDRLSDASHVFISLTSPDIVIMTSSHTLVTLVTLAICLAATTACGEPVEVDGDALPGRVRDASAVDQGARDMARDMPPQDMRAPLQDSPSDMPQQDMLLDDMTRRDEDIGEEPPPPSCDGDPSCVDAFPRVILGTTVGGTSAWSRYACAPETNEGGPERVYRVVLGEGGFLSAQIAARTDEVDIDLHLLINQDPEACLDRGHLATGAYLEPGEYWVVADTWVDELGEPYPGDFELTINLTQASTLEGYGVPAQVARDAFKAFSSAWSAQQTRRLEYAVTDFSMHSSEPRTWVMDLSRGELLFLLTIGHGTGSIVGDDRGVASVFSNTPQSYASSLGMVRAAETYTGDFGYSMRLDGLEPEFNDRVRQRDIVVHPDDRNRQTVTDQQGFLSPSRGCPTLDPTTSRAVIDTLHDGALMFFWYPDETWRQGSMWLN